MDRITLLRAYTRIIDLGSLSAAARDLRVGQSTVSKWLSALEADAGVPLIDRTTRSLRVTGPGELMLKHARQLVEGWDAALAQVQAQAPRVAGRLRVSVPSVFGTRHVVPHLGALLQKHPELELQLQLSDRYVHLLDEDLDVAIRVGVPVPSSLRARKLGGTPRLLVASPEYLQRRGTPEHPSQLAAHDTLVHTLLSPVVYSFTQGDQTVRCPVNGRVSADQSEALRQLAVQGQGLALLARWLVIDDLKAGRLLQVLTDWSPPSAPIRALLPPARHTPARVQALLDHLSDRWAGSALSEP